MNVVPSGKELGKSNEGCIDFCGARRRQLRSSLKGFMLIRDSYILCHIGLGPETRERGYWRLWDL